MGVNLKIEAMKGLTNPTPEELRLLEVYHGSSSGSVVLIGTHPVGNIHTVNYDPDQNGWEYIRTGEGTSRIVERVGYRDVITGSELESYRNFLPGGSYYSTIRVANSSDFIRPTHTL